MACDAPDLTAIWAGVMERARERPATMGLIQKLRLVEVGEQRAVVHCSPTTVGISQTAVKPLTEMLSAILGKPMTVAIIAGAAAPAAPIAPLAASSGASRAERDAVASAPRPITAKGAATLGAPVAGVPGFDAQAHPLVRKTIELFGARIAKVTPRHATAPVAGETPTATPALPLIPGTPMPDIDEEDL